MKPGRYASELRKLVRTHEPERKLDLMIVHALIEARSCERFRLLAKRTASAGARFVRAARAIRGASLRALPGVCAAEFDSVEIDARLALIAVRESELATSPDGELRFHSGPPI